MAPSLFVVGNNSACRLFYYMTRGRRAQRCCGNRFSWTADPNVVIVEGRWMEQVESPPTTTTTPLLLHRPPLHSLSPFSSLWTREASLSNALQCACRSPTQHFKTYLGEPSPLKKKQRGFENLPTVPIGARRQLRKLAFAHHRTRSCSCMRGRHKLTPRGGSYNSCPWYPT